MTWREHDLTTEQRTANWMWTAATGFIGCSRDYAGHGEPPPQGDIPDWPLIPGDQWFDLDTGRAWAWQP